MSLMLWRLLLVIGGVALSLLGGAVGGYLCVQWFAKVRQETHLSSTGYFCEQPGCGAEAMKHRQSDGRRVCLRHRGMAA